ncbi:MAG TPA: hypothetical protein VGI39_41575 [Polyangiaceae bacterium]
MTARPKTNSTTPDALHATVRRLKARTEALGARTRELETSSERLRAATNRLRERTSRLEHDMEKRAKSEPPPAAETEEDEVTGEREAEEDE